MEKKDRYTESLCPVCLKRIPAVRHTDEEGQVILKKTCPEHGDFADLVWRGYLEEEDWRGKQTISDPVEGEGPDCGHCSGLCSFHERGTCCTLLEITQRCNMHCRFCFAQPDQSRDPSLQQVKSWIFDLVVPGKTYLQLSGGEPTVRDDLPEIVAFARKAGCRYIQLNSNGLRLAEDLPYVQALADAGLSFVFLQFDGITEDVFEKLRGRDLLTVKEKAIHNLASCGIGVTLVPVIVPGVNDHQVGDILRFAEDHVPAVRGVHFQPVSYFGRLPGIPRAEDRYTLDQLVHDIEIQTDGKISGNRLLPSRCDHPLCGFHGDFMLLPEGGVYPLSAVRGRQRPGTCTDGEALADQNRRYIGERWQSIQTREGARGKEDPLDSYQETRPQVKVADTIGKQTVENTDEEVVKSLDLTDMDTFLSRVRTHSFTVSAMAFQDAGNIDYERLRRCSLHVYRRGRKIPFCAAYLTDWNS